MIEIICNIVFDSNGIKLEINNTKKFGKFINMWKLNNTLIINQRTKKLPELTQEETQNLNKSITNKEIDSVIKNFPTKNSSGLRCLHKWILPNI